MIPEYDIIETEAGNMPVNPHTFKLRNAVIDFNRRTTLLQHRLAVLGIRYRVTCWYRSPEEQNRLYAMGRTRPGSKVTGCKAGLSPHNYSLARDYAIFVGNKISWDTRRVEWKQFIQAVRDAHLATGADFTRIYDAAHTELPNWQDYVQKEGHI
jgi:hypothetical protein